MILIDEQLPPTIAHFLSDLGLEAVHVRALDMNESPDESIWLIAASRNWVVMTKDSDFLQIAMTTRQGRLIHVGLGNASTSVLRRYLQAHVPRIQRFVQSEARILVLPKADPGEPGI
jgi:predicted nuclease of predicted toxin-antitoxin system